MAVTLSYLLNDRYMLEATTAQVMARRRQLLPFPLDADLLLDVQHPPRIANLIRYLQRNRPNVLMWRHTAFLKMPTLDATIPHLVVSLNSDKKIPLAGFGASGGPLVQKGASDSENGYIDCEGQLMPKLRSWAWSALKIELENQWVLDITGKLFLRATTHQQVHRFMPELYTVMAQQAGNQNRDRAKLLNEALNDVGSKRARKIDIETISPEVRERVQMLLTQALILPVHNGNCKGSQFDLTWIKL